MALLLLNDILGFFYYNFALNCYDILLLITIKDHLNLSMDLFMFIMKSVSGIGMA